MDPRSAETFLTAEERVRLREAIAQAERMTSGEIRVHLEDHCEDDLMDHAAFMFDELGMIRTKDRNGVLLYVSVADRRVAIIGDAGIHVRVGEGFWQDVLDLMRGHFREGHYAQGLIDGVERAGEKLREHFPFQRDDRNELSNEISIDR